MLDYKDKYDIIIIGGTCLNVGCVPTKSLIGASRIKIIKIYIYIIQWQKLLNWSENRFQKMLAN